MDDEKEVSVAEDKEIVGGGDVGDAEEIKDDKVEDDKVEEELPEDEDDTEEVEQPQGRANRRIQSINTVKKEAIERAEKAERDVIALRAQMEEVQRHLHAGRSQQDAVAEAALLEQMDPIQRVQYEADKKINSIQVELRKVQLSSLDATDRATFMAKSQNDPVRAKLMDQVEKDLASMRSKGLNAPREDIYYYLLGKNLAEQKAKGGKSSERDAARGRVESTQGRTSSIRGDAPSGKRGKTAEDRLDGVII